MRSRDFVIDFPRIFVLEAGDPSTHDRTALCPDRLPERSQSALSLAHAKDWMSRMSNKLEEQHGLHGLPRMRKCSIRYELQENLLSVPRGFQDQKRRRSRSADGRYVNVIFKPKVAAMKRGAAAEEPSSDDHPPDGVGCHLFTSEAVATTNQQESRRGSATLLRVLTDASYAQSIQRRREQLLENSRRRGSELPSSFAQPPRGSRSSLSTANLATGVAAEGGNIAAVHIKINGEGIDF